MATRRTASRSLSDNEIRRLAGEIEAGRRPTVWFTAEAVGLREGGSGKIVAIADPTEPDYLRVRPSGSTDTLAFSPDELTLVNPTRHRTTRRT